MYRRIQSLGMAAQYNSDEDFRIQANMFCALAYVKPEDVVAVFNSLKNWVLLDPKFGDSGFLTYFEDTWIGRYGQYGRFKIELWNIYQS